MMKSIILITSTAWCVGLGGWALLQARAMVEGSYLNGINYVDAYLLMLLTIASTLMLTIAILEATRK